MAPRSETRTIGGLSVTTTQLSAMRALPLATRLGKLLAPALARLDGVKMEDGISALAPALTELFSSADPESIQALARDLLANTSVEVDGKIRALSSDDAINAVFSGRLATMFQAMKFAAEVNFADFFAEALNASGSNPPGTVSA